MPCRLSLHDPPVSPPPPAAVVEACKDEPECLAVFRPAVLCCYLRCIGEKVPHNKLDVAIRRVKEAWSQQAQQAQQVQQAPEDTAGRALGSGEDE